MLFIQYSYVLTEVNLPLNDFVTFTLKYTIYLKLLLFIVLIILLYLFHEFYCANLDSTLFAIIGLKIKKCQSSYPIYCMC